MIILPHLTTSLVKITHPSTIIINPTPIQKMIHPINLINSQKKFTNDNNLLVTQSTVDMTQTSVIGKMN